MTAAVALACTAATGALVAVQTRITGELSRQLGDSYATAAVSFGSGLLILCVALACSPRARRGVRLLVDGLRERSLSPWLLTGGPIGAFYAFNQGALTPLMGVAAFTVGVVAGLVVGGLAVDRAGLSPRGRVAVSLRRATGSALVLTGAVLASWPELQLAHPLPILAVPFLVGVGSAIQSALNGRVADRAESVVAATFANFLTGTVLLFAAAFASALVRGWPQAWPESPLLYSAGLIGVVAIAVASLMIRFAGALLLGMALIAGQLAGAVAVEAVAPLGRGIDAPLVAGSALALVALIIAAVPRRAGVIP